MHAFSTENWPKGRGVCNSFDLNSNPLFQLNLRRVCNCYASSVNSKSFLIKVIWCFLFLRLLSKNHLEMIIDIVHSIWNTMLGDFQMPVTDGPECPDSPERRFLPVTLTCPMGQLIRGLLTEIRSQRCFWYWFLSNRISNFSEHRIFFKPVNVLFKTKPVMMI